MVHFLVFAGCGTSFRSPFLFFGRILAVFSMLARFHGRAWGRAGRVRRYVGVIVVSDCVAAVLIVTCRLLRLILPAVASASFFFEEGVLLVVLLLLDFFSSSEPSELHPSLSPLPSSVTTASRIDRGFARCARFELGLLALLVVDLTLADEREAA